MANRSTRLRRVAARVPLLIGQLYRPDELRQCDLLKCATLSDREDASWLGQFRRHSARCDVCLYREHSHVIPSEWDRDWAERGPLNCGTRHAIGDILRLRSG